MYTVKTTYCTCDADRILTYETLRLLLDASQEYQNSVSISPAAKTISPLIKKILCPHYTPKPCALQQGIACLAPVCQPMDILWTICGYLLAACG